MVQVLQELKVGDRDPARIDKDVGEYEHPVVDEHLLCLLGGRPVGSLGQDLAVELVGVVPSISQLVNLNTLQGKVLVDAFLNGRGNENVAGLVEDAVVEEGLGCGVVGDRLLGVVELVLEEVVWVDALLVVDRAVPFDDPD